MVAVSLESLLPDSDSFKPTDQDWELAQRVWDYSILGETPRNADVIWVLGSIDLLPAVRGAELYREGLAPLLMTVGGVGGRNYEDNPSGQCDLTEGEMLAREVAKYGVPYEEILIESESTNSAENIVNARELLHSKGIKPQRVVSVHMPPAERRDKATINKHWPGLDVIMASPQISMREYQIHGYQGQFGPAKFIAGMLGDFQRLKVFAEPKYGFEFMVPQEEPIPGDVLDAYRTLVSRGYDLEELVKDKETGEVIKI